MTRHMCSVKGCLAGDAEIVPLFWSECGHFYKFTAMCDRHGRFAEAATSCGKCGKVSRLELRSLL